MIISDKVFELIKEKKMTQKEFSQLTGIAQSTISDWKRKRTNPTTEKIMTICKVLEVSPEYLLSGVAPDSFRCNEYDYITIAANSEEGQLLIEFQKMDRDKRNRLMGYLKALADI